MYQFVVYTSSQVVIKDDNWCLDDKLAQFTYVHFPDLNPNLMTI